jgi:opacity protein-like surface antigen
LTWIGYCSEACSGTKTGYGLSLGARAKVSGDADVLGAYSYISAGSVSYNNFSLGVKFNITESIFASGGYFSQTGSSSSSGYTIGAGLKF